MSRLLSLLLLLASCSGDADSDISPGDSADRPTLVCPGDDGCAVSPETVLRAGAASFSIEPDCYESWVSGDDNVVYDASVDTFLDCGCDRLCPGDAGYVSADTGEEDGVFQRIFMGGGANNVPAMGVRGPEQGGLRADGDGLFAKAVVLDQGNTTVAIVAVESIGLQYDDTLATRALLAEQGVDVDHLLIHSTHSHLSVDAIGLWGPGLTESGYNEAYFSQIRQTIVEAVRLAKAELVPVSMTVGEVDVSTYSPDKGVRNVVTDTRDPFIIDPMLGAAQFSDAQGQTVATLVSFGLHPETMLGRSAYLSSDFVHALRTTVEDGVVWETYQRAGIGGTTVYLNSTVGGMMTTLRLTNTDPDGNEWGSDGSWEKADAIGQQLGEMALDAVEGGERVNEPVLGVRSQQFFVPIENRLFQTAGLLGVMQREQFNFDPSDPIDDDNQPDVQTEVNVIDVGPLQLLSIPGEMLPEVAVGGYDGSLVNAPGRAIVEVTDNPPDLTTAPEGPYVKDDMNGTYRWIVGLGNDEIGYIIPRYNFKLSADSPYILEAEGHHYEETRSLGPTTAERLQAETRRLIEFQP